jgi:hypothetical protein
MSMWYKLYFILESVSILQALQAAPQNPVYRDEFKDLVNIATGIPTIDLPTWSAPVHCNSESSSRALGCNGMHRPRQIYSKVQEIRGSSR